MHRIASLIAVAALVLSTACGTSAPPAERLAAAPAATVEQGTAKVAFSTSTEVQGQSIESTGEGAVDFDGRRGTMTISMAGVPGVSEEAAIEARFDGTLLYFRMPPEMLGGAQLPTEWIRMDLEEATGPEFEQLAQQMGNDPSQGLDALRGVADDVEEVGSEEVRGTATTHYRGTVDLDRAAAESPSESAAVLEQLKEQLGASTFPVEVWLDDEGRLRRQRQTIDVSSMEGAEGGGSVTTTVEYFDFGAEVDVEAPPEDEVTDITELMGG